MTFLILKVGVKELVFSLDSSSVVGNQPASNKPATSQPAKHGDNAIHRWKWRTASSEPIMYTDQIYARLYRAYTGQTRSFSG